MRTRQLSADYRHRDKLYSPGYVKGYVFQWNELLKPANGNPTSGAIIQQLTIASQAQACRGGKPFACNTTGLEAFSLANSPIIDTWAFGGSIDCTYGSATISATIG
jgi:hypothetical protein